MGFIQTKMIGAINGGGYGILKRKDAIPPCLNGVEWIRMLDIPTGL